MARLKDEYASRIVPELEKSRTIYPDNFITKRS